MRGEGTHHSKCLHSRHPASEPDLCGQAGAPGETTGGSHWGRRGPPRRCSLFKQELWCLRVTARWKEKEKAGAWGLRSTEELMQHGGAGTNFQDSEQKAEKTLQGTNRLNTHRAVTLENP